MKAHYLLGYLHKTLGLTKPIRSMTIHVPIEGLATVTVEYPVSSDDGNAIVSEMKRYMLYELSLPKVEEVGRRFYVACPVCHIRYEGLSVPGDNGIHPYFCKNCGEFPIDLNKPSSPGNHWAWYGPQPKIETTGEPK